MWRGVVVLACACALSSEHAYAVQPSDRWDDAGEASLGPSVVVAGAFLGSGDAIGPSGSYTASPGLMASALYKFNPYLALGGGIAWLALAQRIGSGDDDLVHWVFLFARVEGRIPVSEVVELRLALLGGAVVGNSPTYDGGTSLGGGAGGGELGANFWIDDQVGLTVQLASILTVYGEMGQGDQNERWHVLMWLNDLTVGVTTRF